MFFKQIMLDDSGALSYIIGCPKEKKACVVNPKREIHEYLETASQFDMQITEIFETPDHNERQSGKLNLSALTGARIFFLEKEEQTCGQVAKPGKSFRYGDAEVQVISNNHYSPFANSLLVTDHANRNKPWLVLTRRALMADNLDAENNNGQDLSDKLTDYLGFFETETHTGLTDNMASISRNMFHTSRTVLAEMSLPR